MCQLVLHVDNKWPVYLLSDFTLLVSAYTAGINNRKLLSRERRTAGSLVGTHVSEDLSENDDSLAGYKDLL